MNWIRWFHQWGDWLLVVLVVFQAVAVVARILSLRQRVHAMRRVIVGCWQNYLEALSLSIERLKSVRAYLAQVRPTPHDADLKPLCDNLYQQIRDEIQAMETQLTHMAQAPDDEWYRMSIEWRPALAMRDTIARLIDIIGSRVSPDELDALKAQWRDAVAAEYREGIAQLEQEIRDLKTELEEALARAQEADELRKQLRALQNRQRQDEEEAARERESSHRDNDETDEEIAARMLAELGDDQDLEQAAAKIAAADGEVNYLEQQAIATDDAEEARRLRGRAAWAHQSRRWWNLLHMLRRKTMQLDEMSGKAMTDSAGDEDNRLLAIQEFQEMEARNAEMKKQIGGLSASNRRLTVELEQFDSAKATVDQLRETLERVEVARKSTQRELNNVETMLEQMETDMARMAKENQRLKRMEDKVDKATTEVIEYKTTISHLESALAATKKAHTEEVAQLEQLIEQMQEEEREEQETAREQAATTVPEEEMLKLQAAYDKLNSEMMRANADRVRAEKGEAKVREALAKLSHDHNQLLDRYRELRQS